MTRLGKLAKARELVAKATVYRKHGLVSQAKELLALAKTLIKQVQDSLYRERLARAINAFPKSIKFYEVI